jgi:outer membrane biosynthesis protein TonB
MMDSRERAIVIAVVVAVAGALLAGCARHPPPAAPLPPGPLEVPAVPPRVLAPVATPVEPAPEPDEDAAPPSARKPRPRPQPKPAEPAIRTDPNAGRPDTAAPGPVETRPAEPKGVLQTPLTADDADTEQRIRGVIARARHGLSQVSVRSLGADARGQYETAQRFLGQADEALKARNYMFAQYLADKADLLARGLLGR